MEDNHIQKLYTEITSDTYVRESCEGNRKQHNIGKGRSYRNTIKNCHLQKRAGKLCEQTMILWEKHGKSCEIIQENHTGGAIRKYYRNFI